MQAGESRRRDAMQAAESPAISPDKARYDAINPAQAGLP